MMTRFTLLSSAAASAAAAARVNAWWRWSISKAWGAPA
jgi:hypothetical protein